MAFRNLMYPSLRRFIYPKTLQHSSLVKRPLWNGWTVSSSRFKTTSTSNQSRYEEVEKWSQDEVAKFIKEKLPSKHWKVLEKIIVGERLTGKMLLELKVGTLGLPYI